MFYCAYFSISMWTGAPWGGCESWRRSPPKKWPPSSQRVGSLMSASDPRDCIASTFLNTISAVNSWTCLCCASVSADPVRKLVKRENFTVGRLFRWGFGFFLAASFPATASSTITPHEPLFSQIYSLKSFHSSTPKPKPDTGHRLDFLCYWITNLLTEIDETGRLIKTAYEKSEKTHHRAL